MPLNEQVVDSVTATNFKVMAEGNTALFLESQKMLHHANNQILNMSNQLFAAWGKGLHEPDVVEAMASQKLLSGNDISQQLSSIGGAIASIQQFIKGAQTTPPPTA